MASTTVFPTSASTDSSVGTKDWPNSSNVLADDGTYASNSTTGGGSYTTYYLRALIGDVSSIPSGAQIDGILIEIERKEVSAGVDAKDNIVRLYKNGVGFVGDNKADTFTEWPLSDTVKSYGGASDLWGTTWTRSEVLNMEVGLSVNFKGAAGDELNVDYIKFTIYWSVPPVPKSLSGSSTNSGSLSKSIAVSKALSGSSSNSGSLVADPFTFLFKALSGASTNVGSLATQVAKTLSLAGASTNSGALTKTVKKALSGVCTNAGALVTAIHDFMRLAFDDQDPTVDGTVKYLVELSDTPIPTPIPSDDSLFERGLRRAPEFERSVGRVSAGVSGLSQVRLMLSNLDGKFNSRVIDGWHVRVLRVLASQVVEFIGVVTEWTLGSDVEALVEDREAVVFNELIPKRIITKELAANLPDRDAGKTLKVVHNRATKIPCRLIGIDEVAREWDYELGEGVGKFGNWQSVFTAYQVDSALGDIGGTASGGAATYIQFEAADKRPDEFYQYWWVEITSGTGAGQIRDITNYDGDLNRATPSTNWTTAPDGTSVYRVTEWRFYDGSQGSPYPGIAFLRFKKRLGEGSALDEIFADVDGLPAANVIREIEDWLTNSTWGLGLTINQASFDTLAADTQLSNIKTEWAVLDKTDSGDLIDSLLDIRGMGLVKDGAELKIEADEAKASAGTFGYGDGFYDNIVSINSGGLKHANVRDKIKDLTILYRRNYKEANTYLGIQTATANSAGVDVEGKEVPQFYDNEDANRYLYYLVKKLVSESKRLTITINEEGEPLRERDRITVKIPHLGIDSDFLITRIQRRNGLYVVEAIPYDSTTYTWSQLGSYPTLPDNVIPTDFERTNPDPVSSIITTAGYITLESGGRTGYIDVSWTIPNDGNYQDSAVSVKENGQPSTSYVEVEYGVSGTRITNLEVGKSYDVLVESRNKYGLKGLKAEKLNTSIPGYALTPKTPTGLVGKGGFGRASWEWAPVTQNTDNSAIGGFLKGYEYRIWTAASGGTQVYPKDGGYGFTEDTRAEITDSDGDLTSNARTLYLEVRAVETTGNNPGSLTSRVGATTDTVLQGDITQNEVINASSASVSSKTLSPSGTSLVSASITKRSGTSIRIEFSMDVDASAYSDTQKTLVNVNLKRGSTTIRSLWLHEYTVAENYSVGGIDEDNIASSGTYSYSVESSSVTTNLVGKNIQIRVVEYRND